jgi:hypothetical protein
MESSNSDISKFISNLKEQAFMTLFCIWASSRYLREFLLDNHLILTASDNVAQVFIVLLLPKAATDACLFKLSEHIKVLSECNCGK